MVKHRPSNHPELDFGPTVSNPPKLDSENMQKIPSTLAPIDLETQIQEFRDFDQPTLVGEIQYQKPDGTMGAVPCYLNEFWTARQRQAHSFHEVSYRACFKPQLPAFFIDRLTQPGDVVYDPFMGRGTTLLEAGLKGRIPFGCDINPLSQHLIQPRLYPSSQADVENRLNQLDWEYHGDTPEDLLVFYHPQTLRAICALRNYFIHREASGAIDEVDQWIRLVAINRLTGHSPGFFSVYSMPPNQAVSFKSQTRINERRSQIPPLRDVSAIILKKSKSLLQGLEDSESKNLKSIYLDSKLVVGPDEQTPQIADHTVSLVVTSPPFLDVVDYTTDNWLRCWFVGLDAKSIEMTVPKKVGVWEEAMSRVFKELFRVLKPGGHIAFEVGEVRKGSVKLEESVMRCGELAGLNPLMVMINAQQFTKTANCWGVDNNAKGTNTNLIVIFKKD